MRRAKSIAALFMAAVLAFVVVQGAAAQKTKLPYPGKAVKIGVETYDPTDSEWQALQEYYKYLQKFFNVSFIYSEALKSPEQELAFIESCAAAGAKGIIGYYNIAKGEVVAKCVQYKMFYWGSAIDYPEVLQAYAGSPYLLTGINQGNGEFMGGYEIGKYAVSQGCKNIIYASGGADFGVPMFIERRKGFLKAVEEARAAGREINVIDVSGFPGDAFFAAQSAALSKNVDAVCASFNGLDFWVQPIAAAGKTGKVKLATFGQLNEPYRNAMKNGSVNFLFLVNSQRFGFAIPQIVNAVDGNGMIHKKDGKAAVVSTGYWVIGSSAEYEALYAVVNGPDKAYSGQELLSLVKGYNPRANWDLFEGLVKSYSLKDIQARRK